MGKFSVVEVDKGAGALRDKERPRFIHVTGPHIGENRNFDRREFLFIRNLVKGDIHDEVVAIEPVGNRNIEYRYVFDGAAGVEGGIFIEFGACLPNFPEYALKLVLEVLLEAVTDFVNGMIFEHRVFFEELRTIII